MLTNFDLFFPCSYLIIYLLALKLSFSHLNFKTGVSGGGGAERTIIFYPASLRNNCAYGSTLFFSSSHTDSKAVFKVDRNGETGWPLLRRVGRGEMCAKSLRRTGCCSARHLAVIGLLMGSVMGRTVSWW